MTIALHGLPVTRGVAMGRAVVVAASHLDVAHYFIEPEQVPDELHRLRDARDAVVAELQRLLQSLAQARPGDAPPELAGILDVHLMLLHDDSIAKGIREHITERHYNAEWALVTHLETLTRQFDEMEDDYLRERKADVEQVIERVLRHLQGQPSALPPAAPAPGAAGADKGGDGAAAVPLILVAHDLSPADMLHFRSSVFAGFVTDVGGKTSHTAIVARSMDIPAVVGARTASHLVRQDDWVIIDGDAGVIVIDPSPLIRAEYEFKQRAGALERERLARLRYMLARTLDGQRIELEANIETPADAAAALDVGAVGVGLFRSEFLFMGRAGQLPDEEEQYRAYRDAVEGMRGLPVTIRSIDIGADKPLDHTRTEAHLNPALGLRAIRWSLAEPAMFGVQLRAILRAAAHGPVSLLIPMLGSEGEIRQTLAHLAQARESLSEAGVPYGELRLGAMIEVPAAALLAPTFLRHFDFLSIGTNDLIQYTLAIDRADESVAHLYDPAHPAVLRLIADTIAACRARGKGVAVCGEMAGDPQFTRLLLGLGLRTFSMHPSRILQVKQEILRADAGKLQAWAHEVVADDDPAARLAEGQARGGSGGFADSTFRS